MDVSEIDVTEMDMNNGCDMDVARRRRGSLLPHTQSPKECCA